MKQRVGLLFCLVMGVMLMSSQIWAGAPEESPTGLKTILRAPGIQGRLLSAHISDQSPAPSAPALDAVPAPEQKQLALAPTTLTSVGDTTVLEAYPSMNAGTTADMWVGYDEQPESVARTVRSLVRFNLTSIPSGATINSARLRVYLVGSYDYPNRWRRVTAYRPTADWGETTVTWNNAPSFAEAYGGVDVLHGSWNWYEMDVTNLVRAWMAGTYPNYGIMLRGPEVSGDESSVRMFSTREGPYPPQLVVDYTGAAPSNTPTRTATATPTRTATIGVSPTPTRTRTPTDIPQAEEWKYDDGVRERGAIATDPGYAMEVRFNAVERRQVLRLRYYVYHLGNPVRMYLRDGSGERYSREVTPSVPGGEGWFDWDISGERIFVQGPFSVGFESRAGGGPALGRDETAPIDGHSYQGLVGNLQQITDADFMIRVVVSGRAGGMTVHLPIILKNYAPSPVQTATPTPRPTFTPTFTPTAPLVVPQPGRWAGTQSSSFTVTRDYKLTNLDITVPFGSGSCRITATGPIPIGRVGLYTSIALDSQGRPHISYYDATNGDLKYAHWDGSRWVIHVVDSAGNVGYYTSLALDSADRPHISYYDVTNRDLKYARWDGSRWVLQAVDTVDNKGWWTSLALDAQGRPHISYGDGTNNGLKYARWDGSRWVLQAVDSAGNVAFCTSLELDSAMRPHISYYDAANGNLKYARWDGSQWIIQTVDSTGDVGLYTSLELDAFDRAHISYQDLSNGDLKYARWDGSRWIIQTVESNGDLGWDTSLVLDAQGRPHISYMGAGNNGLSYARWDGSRWIIQVVEQSGIIGWYSSLALDSGGRPHISYYDAGEGDLLYITRPDSVWPPHTVVESITGGDFVVGPVSGRFTSPTAMTGDYLISSCGGTVISPPSSGTWTASWQSAASADEAQPAAPGLESELLGEVVGALDLTDLIGLGNPEMGQLIPPTKDKTR